MQVVAGVVNAQSALNGSTEASPSSTVHSSSIDYKAMRRNGAVVGFEPSEITAAMAKAFLAEGGIRIDSDVLYQALLITTAGKKFSRSELAPAVE